MYHDVGMFMEGGFCIPPLPFESEKIQRKRINHNRKGITHLKCTSDTPFHIL